MANFDFQIFVLLIIAVISASSGSKVDYSGHMVIRVTPETKEQIEFLRDWQSSSSMDFWSIPGNIQQPADIHVDPQSYYNVTRTLDEKMMDHEIIINDLGQLQIEEQQSILLRRANRDTSNAFDFGSYNELDKIMGYLYNLSSDYQHLVSTKVGNFKTVEDRDIVQVTISSDLNAGKKVIFFDCNIHAREWISSTTCLWIIDQLVTGYSNKDPGITALVDKYDWKFVPIANPDGYVYTWAYDRLWVKNRAVNESSACFGVNVNRNFPVRFEQGGSSSQPCSNIYDGGAPFSENESRVLDELMAEDRGRVLSAISVHASSQSWMSPYGYTTNLPSNYTEMMRVMSAGVEALRATYGTVYQYGSYANLLYIASGITTDYYYDVGDVFHAYTIALRDMGRNGFELPPEYIIPTAEETWIGILAMINAIEPINPTK